MKRHYLLSIMMLMSVAGSAVAMETGEEATTGTTECSYTCKVTGFVKTVLSDTLGIVTDLPSDLLTGDNALFRHPQNFLTNSWGHRKAILGTVVAIAAVQYLDDIKAALGFGDDEEGDEDEL